MPGFLISHPYRWQGAYNLPEDRFLTEKKQEQGDTLFRSTLRKFEQDKLFQIEEHYRVILDGCLLNKETLMLQYRADSLFALILKMYGEGRQEEFFREFRGPFCGALYDKKRDIWFIFTNHTGEKCVYYYQHPQGYVASTDVNWIYDICKENQLSLSIDENGVYQLLTFGFMEDDSTCAKEIKRLRGGTYLRIERGQVAVKSYHTFIKDRSLFEGCREEELVELVENAFAAAVKMEFDKDMEYGYGHICDISGGLDSRMNMWVAHDMGYQDFQLLTYCKSNYLDELIAKEIAAYWKDALLVKPLDDIRFFYDIDKLVKMNGGTSLYCGITGGERLLETLDWKSFGIQHTGMIGDAVLGSFAESEEEFNRGLPSGRYSERLRDRLKTNRYQKEFQDHEIYLQYTRCFRGAANTIQIRNYFTEVWSPFMEPDFLQMCMNIPVEFRAGHRIYKTWILKKHPAAAEYRWEKINGLLTESKTRLRMRKLIQRGPQALKRRIGGNRKAVDYGMNPLDYWIERDSQVSGYMEAYFEKSETYCSGLLSDELRKDLRLLFETGNGMEKCMALTGYGALMQMLDGEPFVHQLHDLRGNSK